MNNIKVIRTRINVSKFLTQLKQHKSDWGAEKNIEGTSTAHKDFGFPVLQAGVLQLSMGTIAKEGDYVGDSEFSVKTPAYYRHTEIVGFMKRHFHKHDRCGFLSLPVGGTVGKHIDIGSYYQNRDRYHLSIAGRYEYTVGEESYIVEPGTLMWFDNKLPHGTRNMANEVRITFVFDVPHNKNNPK